MHICSYIATCLFHSYLYTDLLKDVSHYWEPFLEVMNDIELPLTLGQFWSEGHIYSYI